MLLSANNIFSLQWEICKTSNAIPGVSSERIAFQVRDYSPLTVWQIGFFLPSQFEKEVISLPRVTYYAKNTTRDWFTLSICCKPGPLTVYIFFEAKCCNTSIYFNTYGTRINVMLGNQTDSRAGIIREVSGRNPELSKTWRWTKSGWEEKLKNSSFLYVLSDLQTGNSKEPVISLTSLSLNTQKDLLLMPPLTSQIEFSDLGEHLHRYVLLQYLNICTLW